MTQAALAERLNALGFDKKGKDGDTATRLDRVSLSKIESGTRRVTLEEALAIACALEVAPPHLFVPREAGASVSLVPVGPVERAEDVWLWATGRRPLPEQEQAPYRAAAPRHSEAVLATGADLLRKGSPADALRDLLERACDNT